MIRCHLSRLMGIHKHSLEDVHRATGISRTTLSQLYHEKNSQIRYETIERLCTFYQCTVGDLLEWVPVPEGKKR